ncbi:hypothetical protein V2J09_013736 [Rumex salicifolius]
MVGLSIVLEPHKNGTHSNTISTDLPPMVINKILKPPPPRAPPSFHLQTPASTSMSSDVSSFLDVCFLCRHKLLPSKDIYIYMGETAFCSEECRSEHIVAEKQVGEDSRRACRRRPAGIRAAGRFG